MLRPPSFALASLALAVAATVGFTVALDRSEALTPPGHVHSGLVQGDMPTYLCYARATLRTASQLEYASPHDVRDDAPPLLVNLPISLTGALLQAGLDERGVDRAIRLVFGSAMLWLAMLLAARVVRPMALRWTAALVVAFGAGFAWLEAWWKADGTPSWAELRGAIGGIETEYVWWFLDTFRNLTYPLECIYHVLMFAMMLALGTERRGLAVGMLAGACLANPFVGLQAGGVFFLSEALAWVSARDRRRFARARRGFWIAGAVVFLGFVVWYGVVQPLDPALASLQRQHAGTLAEPLSWKGLLRGHGPAAFFWLTLLDPRFRRRVIHDASLRPILALALVTLALVEQTHLTTSLRLMPMHFTRGYLHLAAWLVVFAWVAHRVPRTFGLRGSTSWFALVLPALLVLDNVAFVQARATELPQRPHLVWTDATQEVLDALRAIPGSRRVLVHEEALGRNVCAYTPHRSLFGTALTTPFNFQRDEQMRAWNERPDEIPPIVAVAHVVVLPRGRRRHADALEAHGWSAGLENTEWRIFVRDDPAVPTDAVPTDAVPTDAVPTDAVPTDAVPTDAVPTRARSDGAD